MRQKREQPKFGEAEGDPFKGDALNRAEEIRTLTPLIKTITSPAVMAIDSSWGTGKTAFIKMWHAYLKKEDADNIRAVCFNAWATDFVADPMVPFLGEMEKELSDDNAEGWNVVKTAGLKLLPDLIAYGVGAIPGVGGCAGDAAKKIARVLADDAVKSYKNQTQAISDFKGTLEKYIKSSERRVVVFVDELDRCRPDYAVKVLERIKHLFEVEGVVFVLALDKKQLCYSIKGLYGADLDADKYLRRFIDFDYTMKPPEVGAYWGVLLDELGITVYLGEGASKELRDALVLLDKIHGFSLRDAEQIMLRINLVLRAIGKEKRVYPAFLAFLVATRDKAPEEFASYLAPEGNGESTVKYWEDKIHAVGMYTPGGENLLSAAGNITVAILVAKNPHNREYLQAHAKSYQEKSKDERLTDEKQGYAYQVMSQMVSIHRYGYAGDILDHHIRKIELLDQFPDDNS